MKIYHEELAHVIKEAEKSHDLLSVSWRPRKVSGVIQSEFEDLGIRGADGINPSRRAGEDEIKCPSSIGEVRKNWQIPPTPSLVLFTVSTDWMTTTFNEEGNLLY